MQDNQISDCIRLAHFSSRINQSVYITTTTTTTNTTSSFSLTGLYIAPGKLGVPEVFQSITFQDCWCETFYNPNAHPSLNQQ